MNFQRSKAEDFISPSLLCSLHRAGKSRAGRLVQDWALAVSLHAGHPHVLLPVAHLLDVHRGDLPPRQGLHQYLQPTSSLQHVLLYWLGWGLILFILILNRLKVLNALKASQTVKKTSKKRMSGSSADFCRWELNDPVPERNHLSSLNWSENQHSHTCRTSSGGDPGLGRLHGADWPGRLLGWLLREQLHLHHCGSHPLHSDGETLISPGLRTVYFCQINLLLLISIMKVVVTSLRTRSSLTRQQLQVPNFLSMMEFCIS